MVIELYVKNKMVDLGTSIRNIRLARSFIDTQNLSVKDAQKSYNLTLPLSPVNNEIFGYKNIEEALGSRFDVYNDVKLYAYGKEIFSGDILISEISREGYKINLALRAQKSVTDVFGEMKMNQAGKWIIPFNGVTSVTEYNNKEQAECIFPFVLYGLLPKTPDGTVYSPKDVYDDTVTLGLDDFPPSVNVIQMIKTIFKNAGYNLTGSALTDEALTNLYVSYKNPNDYELSWNTGQLNIKGSWASLKDDHIERKIHRVPADIGLTGGVVDTFNADNTDITILDTGNNIHWDASSQRNYILINQSGLYKLNLDVTLELPDRTFNNGSTGVLGSADLSGTNMEFHILRNRTKPFNDLYRNNNFYRDNIDQGIGDEGAKFPKDGEVNFIDIKQDETFISGFSFGRNPYQDGYNNPVSSSLCNPMAIRNGFTWSANNPDSDTRNIKYSAVYSEGYVHEDGTDADTFKINLLDNGSPKRSFTRKTDNRNASGSISQVVWLEKGDRLDVINIQYYYLASPTLINWQRNHRYTFDFKLEPFVHNKNWIKIDLQNQGTGRMNWDDRPTFIGNYIDLIKFLPSETKVDDWINNFCNTFNLKLSNPSGKNFLLNTQNRGLSSTTSNIIDIDKKGYGERTNTPLDLPMRYKLGFTVENSEEGYYTSMDNVLDEEGVPTDEKVINSGYDGGGIFYTNYPSTNTIDKKSNFSYCWYKDLKDKDGNVIMSVPVITEHDIWDFDYDYEDMENERYYNSNQRFWFRSGVRSITMNDKTNVEVALVSNRYEGINPLTLDYEDKKDSIARRYFLILTNDKFYTNITTLMTPEEYEKVSRSIVIFNGDAYSIARLDGYDPLGVGLTTLKLVKRIREFEK